MSEEDFFYRLAFKQPNLEDDYDLGEWYSECDKIGDELLAQVSLNHKVFARESDFDEEYTYWMIEFTTNDVPAEKLSKELEKLSELIKKYPQISLSRETD